MVATCAFRHDPFDFLDRRKRRKTRRRICSSGDSRPISTMDLHSPDELLYSLFNVPWILDKRDLCFQCFATRIYAIRISVCNELRACLLNVRDIVKKEHSFKKIFNSRCMKRKFQFQLQFKYHLYIIYLRFSKKFTRMGDRSKGEQTFSRVKLREKLRESYSCC